MRRLCILCCRCYRDSAARQTSSADRSADDVRPRDIGKLSTMRIVCAGRGVRTAVMLNDLPRLLNGVVDCGSCERVDGSDNVVIALEALRGARVVFKTAVNIDQPAVLFSEPVQLRLEPRSFSSLTHHTSPGTGLCALIPSDVSPADTAAFTIASGVSAPSSKVVWQCRFCFIIFLSSVIAAYMTMIIGRAADTVKFTKKS